MSRRLRFHHLGIPTTDPHEGEVYLERFRTYVAGFDESIFGVEWMRFEEGSPLPELVRTVPHLAFVVDDLEAELAGREVLIPPNRPSEGITVAFVVDRGAPIEFLQFDGPELEVWPGGAATDPGDPRPEGDEKAERPNATVVAVESIELTGRGDDPAWEGAEWIDLAPLSPGPARYRTRARLAWSNAGLYLHAECDDRRLTCSDLPDGGELYTEDVVELFLRPDPTAPLYLEVEISPFGRILPLLVANRDGRFHGWLARDLSGARALGRAASVRGGEAVPGAGIQGWSAELFVPFALLEGIVGSPPTRGDRWSGNVTRIDYDETPRTLFSWASGLTTTFHRPERFGTLVFGGPRERGGGGERPGPESR